MMKNKTAITVAAITAGAAVGAAAGTAAVLYTRKKALEAAQPALCLAEAPQVNPGIAVLPLGLRMAVTDYAPGTITAQVDNQSGYTMSLGQEYWLERMGAAGWELVEPSRGLAFGAESITLADLEKVTLTMDVSAFEPLCAGTYRLCKTDLEAPFQLKVR